MLSIPLTIHHWLFRLICNRWQTSTQQAAYQLQSGVNINVGSGHRSTAPCDVSIVNFSLGHLYRCSVSIWLKKTCKMLYKTKPCSWNLFSIHKKKNWGGGYLKCVSPAMCSCMSINQYILPWNGSLWKYAVKWLYIFQRPRTLDDYYVTSVGICLRLLVRKPHNLSFISEEKKAQMT